MSEQKRLLWFMILSLVSWLALQAVLESMGLLPKPKPPVVAENKVLPPPPLSDKQLAALPAFADMPGGPLAFAPGIEADLQAARAAKNDVPLAGGDALILGLTDAKADPATSYHMQANLTQDGAGVARIALAYHEAEIIGRAKTMPQLAIIDADRDRFPDAPMPPLGLSLSVAAAGDPEQHEFQLGDRLWEVVPDARGNLRRTLSAEPDHDLLEGQAVVFRTKLPVVGLTVTKTISLRKGRNALDMDLKFEATRPLTLTYSLQGPYGVPVEGEWYTSVFREAFFGKINGENTEIETKSANDVVDHQKQGDPVRATSLPIKFAGIENQYFAVFVEPHPLPSKPADRWDEKTVATVIAEDKAKHKSEISVVIDTREFKVGPGGPLEHGYYFYAGTKQSAALAPYGATDLSSYRKGWQIPLIGTAATFLARTVIAPLLDQIYGFTKAVAGLFGGQRGNYGVAIILLTIAVRMMMFPLSRKQAQSAKRMQDLQPQLIALKEKYKDDKEQVGRETLSLYQKNGVNPFGGCLLVLIQMPIFLGLWQALNNSVALRHADFLWIRNLAAPDQLFAFPGDMPFLGPYFNLLPFVVIGLMLVQTKLFSPPATTPEQQQQQSMMKWMLVVMMMMFYKVPSGLGLYFIMSSTWSIGERLLLPKITKSKPLVTGTDAEPPPQGRKALLKPKGPAPAEGNGKKPGRLERLRERLEKVIEDAEHQKTARNATTPERTNPRRPKPRRK